MTKNHVIGAMRCSLGRSIIALLSACAASACVPEPGAGSVPEDDDPVGDDDGSDDDDAADDDDSFSDDDDADWGAVRFFASLSLGTARFDGSFQTAWSFGGGPPYYQRQTLAFAGPVEPALDVCEGCVLLRVDPESVHDVGEPMYFGENYRDPCRSVLWEPPTEVPPGVPAWGDYAELYLVPWADVDPEQPVDRFGTTLVGVAEWLDFEADDLRYVAGATARPGTLLEMYGDGSRFPLDGTDIYPVFLVGAPPGGLLEFRGVLTLDAYFYLVLD